MRPRLVRTSTESPTQVTTEPMSTALMVPGRAAQEAGRGTQSGGEVVVLDAEDEVGNDDEEEEREGEGEGDGDGVDEEDDDDSVDDTEGEGEGVDGSDVDGKAVVLLSSIVLDDVLKREVSELANELPGSVTVVVSDAVVASRDEEFEATGDACEVLVTISERLVDIDGVKCGVPVVDWLMGRLEDVGDRLTGDSFARCEVEKLVNDWNRVDVGTLTKHVVESTPMAVGAAVAGSLQGVSRIVVAQSGDISVRSFILKRLVVVICRAVGAFPTLTVTSPCRQNTVSWDTKVLMYKGLSKKKTVDGAQISGHSSINAA